MTGKIQYLQFFWTLLWPFIAVGAAIQMELTQKSLQLCWGID